jgi:hypothetical protein
MYNNLENESMDSSERFKRRAASMGDEAARKGYLYDVRSVCL